MCTQTVRCYNAVTTRNRAQLQRTATSDNRLNRNNRTRMGTTPSRRASMLQRRKASRHISRHAATGTTTSRRASSRSGSSIYRARSGRRQQLFRCSRTRMVRGLRVGRGSPWTLQHSEQAGRKQTQTRPKATVSVAWLHARTHTMLYSHAGCVHTPHEHPEIAGRAVG